jgi:hypothetical protein
LRESPQIVTRWLNGQKDWPAVFRNEISQSIKLKPHRSTSVDLPLAEDAKRVIAYAAEEADRLKHQHIGTEHLFLGLLREPKSYVGKMLLGFGVNIDTVRETLAKEGEQHGLSGFGTGFGIGGERGSRSILLGLGSLSTLKVLPIQFQFNGPARLPVIGETLLLESGTYRVTNVEWKVGKEAGRPTSISRVVIYAQSLNDTNS